jgi:hypothetical protein
MGLETVLDHGDTVTDEYCGTLERLQQAIHHSRPGFLSYDIIILHSNSRLHTTNQTCNWLWCYGWEVNSTLPSPNLKPSDLNFSGPLKKHLAGMRFATDVGLKKAVVF